MKKYLISLNIISLAGLFLTVLLFVDFFFPEFISFFFNCKTKGAGCFLVTGSQYSVIGNIPIVSFGLFYYLWIFLTVQIFSESGYSYRNALFALLAPVSLLALIPGAIFLFLLFMSGNFSIITIVGFLISSLLAVVSLINYKKIYHGTYTPMELFKKFSSSVSESEDKKFSTGSFLYFTSFLFLFVMAFSLFLNGKQAVRAENQPKRFIEEYKSYIDEKISFPPTTMKYGTGKIPIVIYTDPLCPACRSFYKALKEVYPKFSDKITVNYFFYPLDSTCNKGVSREIHPGACRLTKIFAAAGNAGLYEKVIAAHYGNYEKISELVSEKKDESQIIAVLLPDTNDQKKLLEKLKDPEIDSTLEKNLAFAESIKIEATPTFFMNGKRIEGSLKKDDLDDIISYEISTLPK